MNKLLSYLTLALINYLLYAVLNVYVFIFIITFIYPIIYNLRQYYIDRNVKVYYDEERDVYVKMIFRNESDKNLFELDNEND